MRLYIKTINYASIEMYGSKKFVLRNKPPCNQRANFCKSALCRLVCDTYMCAHMHVCTCACVYVHTLGTED